MAEETTKAKEKRPTAKKRDIQNQKRKMENRSFKSKVKTAVRAFEKLVSDKKETEAKTDLNEVYSLIDKGVKLGVFKLNKASRLKHKFASKV